MSKHLVRFVLVVAVLAASACTPTGPGPSNTPPSQTGPSRGCGTTERGPTTESAEYVTVDGVTRRFALTIPSGHVPNTAEALPLVLDFHGLIEGMVATHPFATQFSAKAQDEQFIVAFPTGSGDGFNWDINLNESNPDLRFVDELVATLESTLCIDQSRMYITGLSYGGFMTSMLMCMRPNTFAAAAPVAGMWNLCSESGRAIPFLGFHGTADWILPYPLFANQPGDIANRYGCGAPTERLIGPGRDPATGGEITHVTWDCSAVDSAAQFYRIDGGGHTWPGSEFFSWLAFIVGPTPTSIDATEVIWEFFEQHQL